MRTAYKVRAYPEAEQAAILARTFGCVRLVWNKALIDRRIRYDATGKHTSYAATDTALTTWKKTTDLAFLREVSSVPLQQALRHQYLAFANFFARRARYPRFKSRYARQTAHYTRSAFRIRDGELFLAKSTGPLRLAWSFPVPLSETDPTMVIISREPDGRWYATLRVVVEDPAPLKPTRRAVGVDANAGAYVHSTGKAVTAPDALRRRQIG